MNKLGHDIKIDLATLSQLRIQMTYISVTILLISNIKISPKVTPMNKRLNNPMVVELTRSSGAEIFALLTFDRASVLTLR